MKRDDFAINLATLNPGRSFEEAIDACARLGITKVGALRDQIYRAGGVAASSIMLRERGLTVSSLVRAGLFTASDLPGRQAAIEDVQRAIEEAAALDAECLIILAGGLSGSRDLLGAREIVADGLATVLPLARRCAVPLALEPLHPMYAADRCCINTLKQALDLCERLGDGIGVVVDTYHTWWDPELELQIARAGSAERLYAFHLSDWLNPTQHMLLDRGMMGDGVIDFTRFVRAVGRAGYAGPVEVELFSANDWWTKDPADVVALCTQRLEALLEPDSSA